jgi:hypothetical protein
MSEIQITKPEIEYKKGYKYQIVKDYAVQTSIFPPEDVTTRFLTLTKKGILQTRSGYAWDGPSGPTIDTKTFMRGSLGHDGIFQLIRMGKIDPKFRIAGDIDLRRICLEDKMCGFRAWYVYHSVSKFAESAADPDNKKKIIIAP